MAKAGLILTSDYEIFGNGSGCVEKCMIEPTNRMVSALEKHGAKLTLFVDVCEYWAFEKEFLKGTLSTDWAEIIRNQLRDLAKRGHDVQLHFHPQWLDYSFDGTRWTLNYDLWRIGRLKYENIEFPERGLKELFARGKQTLEDIIKPVMENYRCHIFRAGAWSIQPETEVLKAMHANGFDTDSTVAPGLTFQDNYTFYDFSKSSDKPYWNVEENLVQPSQSGKIREIPIFTTTVPLLKRMKFILLKKDIAMKPEGCSGTSVATAGKSKVEKLREVLWEKKKMFTFGDATSFEEMTYFAQQALNRAKMHDEKYYPVVGISHPKTFANNEEFERFLKWVVKHKNDFEFIKYNQI